jgi:hypothetical protein
VNIKYDKDKGEMRLSQEQAIDDVIKQFDADILQPRATPLPQDLKNDTDKEDEPTNKNYRSLLGCMMYPMQWTRPDVAYAVGYLGQHSHRATEEHWELAMSTLRYLKGTKSFNFKIGGKRNNQISVYTDSNWASTDSARSVYGFAIFVGENLVSLKSKKDTTVATSSTTAELRAMYHGVQESLWIKSLLEEMGLGEEIKGPITVHQDNQSTIKVISNERITTRVRHELVKVAYLQERIKEGAIKVTYCRTENMTADIFTKSLPRAIFTKHRGNLGMVDMASRIEGECCFVNRSILTTMLRY